ncbi:hypothetical protein PMAYCL1PPCAC_21157, partial [Pristionchus mayeri]
LHALERVICLITERRPSCTIPLLFHKEWTDCTTERRLVLFNDSDRREGYWRIMKLVATPTRILFAGYDIVMGNRVLNKYARNENHIIRLSFRDERGAALWMGDYAPEVQDRIKGILVNGITYAGRTFAWLRSSNSQLRDQGCYMIHVDFKNRSSKRPMPRDIHREMGYFHNLPNIPKMLARLGQVFTQCKTSDTTLFASEVGVAPDFIGGRNVAGKPFVFSDGVG